MKKPTRKFPFSEPFGKPAKKTPIKIFSKAYEALLATKPPMPSAVYLATSTRCGAPSCRVVLIKDFSEEGFVIYTNLKSRKGEEISENPQAALCFYWPELRQQVRVEGYVTEVSDAEADTYFATRPLKSRIGAWASKQSELLPSRSTLMKRIAYYSAKWAVAEVKRPPHWSGIRIVPDYFEFWQDNELHVPERKIFYLREDVWYEGNLYP